MAKKKLNEAPPIDYGDGRERMSPDIERKLKSQDHPLGGHQAFPDVDKDGIPDNFEELIASQRFQDVVQKVKDATGVENIDPQTFMSLQPMLMQAARRIVPSISTSGFPVSSVSISNSSSVSYSL